MKTRNEVKTIQITDTNYQRVVTQNFIILSESESLTYKPKTILILTPSFKRISGMVLRKYKVFVTDVVLLNSDIIAPNQYKVIFTILESYSI